MWTNWDIFFKDLDWQSFNKYQCKHWSTRTNSEVPRYSQYCRLLHSRFFEFLSWVERTERVWTNWDIFFKDLDWQSFNKYQCKRWSTSTNSSSETQGRSVGLGEKALQKFLSTYILGDPGAVSRALGLRGWYQLRGSEVWPIPYACAQPYHSGSGTHTHLGSNQRGRWSQASSLARAYAMLMNPNENETAVHGCHYYGDTVVLLAIPRRGVGTCDSRLKLVWFFN